MEYLSEQNILLIHALIIDETGGSHGVRDIKLLQSIMHRPRAAFGGRDMYDSLWHKAAAYLEALVLYHVFVDGNKRTGIAAAAYFLSLNGYEFTASNDAVVTFALIVVSDRSSIEDIVSWLKKHTKKIRKSDKKQVN